MSSLRVLAGYGVSSALRRRLGMSSMTSRNWLSSYHFTNELQCGRILSGSRPTSEASLRFGRGIPSQMGFHGSAPLSRGAAQIDDSLHRLDAEIRKVGRIRRQEVDDILQDIKQMKKATSSQSLMIIRCCGELIPEEPPNSRTELVQRIWNTLDSLKVAMDVSHYNALLRVYLENEHKFNPTEFLQEITSKGIEPNRVTYQRLIARYCQDGDIDGASTILQHMKEKQLPINEYVFNSLIMGHGQANDMESAEGILAVMSQAGLEANDDTYVTLMTCYAKHGDIGNIKRIVKECEEKEIFLIDRDFLNVIYALVANNHNQYVDEILPYLKKHSGFNQEATNLIFKLININQEEVAYKMLKQMTPILRQEEAVPSGNFFIKHLVQSSKPSEIVFKYCKALQDDGLHKYAFTRACEAALQARKFDLAKDLFEALQQNGLPVRQHYFWPLFANAASENDVSLALKCMRGLDMIPSTETLREYVIPKVLENNNPQSFESALHRLSSMANVSLNTLIPASMLHMLSIGEMNLAAELASRYKLRFGNPQLRRALIEAYLKHGNAVALAQTVGRGCTEGDDSGREYVGMILLELAESIRQKSKKEEFLLPVLKQLHANGLGLSNSGSELLQNHLGEALTPELTNAILQLTSPDLTPKVEFTQAVSRKSGQAQPQQLLEDRSSEELEAMLAEASKRNAPTKSIRKSLLYSYCREKNLEKMQILKDELTKEDFVFTPGLQAMFLDLYTTTGKVEEAKSSYREIQKSLDFVMDDLKLLRYAALLQSTGDLEGCIEILKTAPRDESRKPGGATQQATVWKLLNSLAESSSPEKVKEVFTLLTERNLTPVNAVVLGPLISSHLVQEDLAGALQEFETCVGKYHVTPYKQELFCRFIKLEDADRLQKVMDLSTSIHGEINSMYDLVFAFIDCGKIRQAKKILETPGLRARNDKIELFCQRYSQDSKIEELENLLQVTKDLVDVDRNTMYFYLLQAYCKLNDADKALSVWTSMQEENLQPSVELLRYLADFLRKNNRPIPFIEPDSSEVSLIAEGGTGSSLSKSVSEFRKSIDLNDVDKALQLKQRIEAEGSTISLGDLSNLVEGLARAERLNEATRITDQLLEQGQHPYPRTFRFLLGRLANAGDINTFERISDKISTDLKRTTMFNSRLCSAYTTAGRGAEFFENVLKKIVESAGSSATTPNTSQQSQLDDAGEDQEEVGNVPVFSSTLLLNKNEHLLNEFEKLAETARDAHHKRALYNALWAYYMGKKDFNRAKEIWDAHLRGEFRILFRYLLLDAKKNNDIELAQALSSQVMENETLRNSAKAVAFSCTLDILANNNPGEALSFLGKSLKVVALDDYPVAVLTNLKEKAEAANLKFPYEIPNRRTRTRRRKALDSSDSDSD